MRPMELRELGWFIILAETEHVTIAAARLHISQPTLSRALARLERKLGVQLFDRHQNRLRLNKYGEIFQAHAVRAMDEIAQGQERITTLVDPERGVVSLGFLHSFGGWLVPELLTVYRGIAPSTSFELNGGAADTVVDDVRKGRVDVGFVAPRPAADDLEWIPLGREVLCLAVPPGHKFEGRDQIAVTDLVDEPMVALKVGYGLRHVADRLFREAGLTPRIRIEVTELSTLRALVSSGMGVALVPAPQPGQASTTGSVPLSDAGAFRSYGALARQYGPSGRAARRFLSFVAGRAVPQPPAGSERTAD
jgi:LysR family transcriptional activator of glutamate synthase operon